MSDKKPLPVIRKALGEQWDALSDLVRKHYDITPGEASDMLIEGVMDEVYHSAVAKLFLLPGQIFGALVPYKGKAIPTTVRNWTARDNDRAMFWYRTLSFPGKPAVVFKSRMEHSKDDEIIEFVKFGMGIRMRMSVSEGALVFDSIGYVWKIGPVTVPIPTWAILGDAKIVERAISDQEFYIQFDMVHPLFGRTFSYSGTFSIAC